jgi:hypothetical protein
VKDDSASTRTPPVRAFGVAPGNERLAIAGTGPSVRGRVPIIRRLSDNDRGLGS